LTAAEQKRLDEELGAIDADNSETISFEEAEAAINAAK